MSSKARTSTPEEKKILAEIQFETSKLIASGKSKDTDRTKINELTAKWKKLKGVSNDKTQSDKKIIKKEDKKEELNSSPVLVPIPTPVNTPKEKLTVEQQKQKLKEQQSISSGWTLFGN